MSAWTSYAQNAVEQRKKISEREIVDSTSTSEHGTNRKCFFFHYLIIQSH